MKKNIEEHIKNKVFESCKKIYNAELLYCEGVNGFNKNEINEANKIIETERKNILLRMQDYESFYFNDFDNPSELNFNDYNID